MCVKYLTAKGAGHSGCIGAKHICDFAFGAFLLLLQVNTLQYKQGGNLRAVNTFTVASPSPAPVDRQPVTTQHRTAFS